MEKVGQACSLTIVDNMNLGGLPLRSAPLWDAAQQTRHTDYLRGKGSGLAKLIK
jgi:hypothetical protein